MADLNSLAESEAPKIPTDTCLRHGETMSMYCLTHNVVGCASCMFIDHRTCQDAVNIHESLVKQTPPPSIPSSNDIQHMLEHLQMQLNELISSFQQEKENIPRRKARTIEDIRKCRKEINVMLDQLEHNSIIRIEENFEVEMKKIKENIKILQKNKEVLASTLDKMNRDAINESQNFVDTRKHEAAVRQARKCMNESIAEGQPKEIIFIADPKITTALEQLNSLGTVTQRDMPNQLYTRSMLLYATETKKFSVKLSTESKKKTCTIFSSCFLENGNIVLADGGNNKLKCLDKYSYFVKSHYDLPWVPCQVCPTNNLEDAVSKWHGKEILFIYVGDEMIKRSVMKLKFNCFGLAYAGSNLYISDELTRVYVYSMSGKELKEFNLFQSNLVNSTVLSLAVSKDLLRVYAAVYSNGLTVLSTDGQVVKKYNGPELNEAFDCHAIGKMGVLVTGYKSNNVLQLTQEGDLVGEVLISDGGNGGCKSVSCDEKMSKMIIGRSNDEIEVYHLVYNSNIADMHCTVHSGKKTYIVAYAVFRTHFDLRTSTRI